MYNYKLVIGFDGSRYQGWQKNKNAKDTIQSKLEYAIGEAVGERIELIGSGRTDKGVHAAGQAANFLTNCLRDVTILMSDINAKLPEDIIIKSIEPAEEKFHARFLAVDKTYCYSLWKADAKERPLFERKYVTLLESVVDVSLMKEASKLFIGTHEFKGFSSDKTKKSTVRTITAIDIEEDDNQIKLCFTGDGFLYNMVRILVGTLIEIGIKERSEESIKLVFDRGIREEAGYTAPAKGLCLMQVRY